MRCRRAVSLLMATALLLGACTGGADDMGGGEPETGEDDREVVPGEGGPVD